MDNFVSELTHLGVIEINGDDATEFLQAQLTSDVKQLNQHQWQLSAWCNPQGRIISNFICIRADDSYFLLLSTDLLTRVCRRLNMYILRSKVTIINHAEDIKCYGICGDISSLMTGKPETTGKLLRIELPDKTQPRAIILQTAISGADPMTLLPTDISRLNYRRWQLMDVMTGLAWITEETSELIIPQELGLDRANALSLSKGCFPGQEIIARMHYRGKVKYGPYIGRSALSEPVPQAGAKLYTKNKAESCGTIINIVDDESEHLQILAVINHQHAQLDEYYLDDSRRLFIEFKASTLKIPPQS